MLDSIIPNVTGHILIRDGHTKETIVEKNNAIHFGNMATAIAQTLVGDPNFFIRYMTFGNNGTIVNESQITYKPPRTSTVENTNASLYNTVFILQMTNEATDEASSDPNNFVIVPLEQSSSTFKDIVATVLLDFGDSGPVGQNLVDGVASSTIDTVETESDFVFDEISLYAGPTSAMSGKETSNFNDIDGFIVNQQTLMLTHVIFHPVQKSQNRSLEIVYTLRIQMGES